jgi:hypothetical protein
VSGTLKSDQEAAEVRVARLDEYLRTVSTRRKTASTS